MRSYFRLRTVIGMVLGLLAMVPIAIIGIMSMRAAAPFRAMQARLATACAPCQQAPMDGATGYRRGKVLVAYRSGAVIGVLMAQLQGTEVGAANADEAGTLAAVGDAVVIEQTPDGDGNPRYRIYRDLCLVDLGTGKVILRTTLGGEVTSDFDPGTTNPGDPLSGSLVDYLMALNVE